MPHRTELMSLHFGGLICHAHYLGMPCRSDFKDRGLLHEICAYPCGTASVRLVVMVYIVPHLHMNTSFKVYVQASS